jgi:predicted nucleic acid-binding protein
MVLDTDVVSFLFKKDTRARHYRRFLHGQDRIVSFMTLAELDCWATRRNWGAARREALERFLEGFTVVYADRAFCRLWAEVTDRARRGGEPIECADAWMAATALGLGVSLVTHNAADYTGVDGLTILTAGGTGA